MKVLIPSKISLILIAIAVLSSVITISHWARNSRYRLGISKLTQVTMAVCHSLKKKISISSAISDQARLK